MDHNERKAWERAIESITDARILLLAVFFVLLATFGLGLPAVVGLLAGAGTVGVAAAVNAMPPLRTARRDALSPAIRAELLPRTPQSEFVAQIDAARRRLSALRDAATLADAVKDSAAEAVVACTSALQTATTVAQAVDQLDAAIGELSSVSTAAGSRARLTERRTVMLDRLNRTLAGVLDVYSKLVETNATVNTSSILEAGDAEQLQHIGASLDDLRAIVGELDKDTGHPLAQ
jgi:hypothetical protein